MSEDAKNGNLIFGATKRRKNDDFDYLSLFKLVTTNDGSQVLYNLTTDAVHTVVTPSRYSIDALESSRNETLSISLNYASLLATKGYSSI